MTPSQLAALQPHLDAWNAAQRRAHIAYEHMPTSNNRSHPTPCNTCGQNTRAGSGFCSADCKRKGKR